MNATGTQRRRRGMKRAYQNLAAVRASASPWNRIPRLSRCKPAEGADRVLLSGFGAPLVGFVATEPDDLIVRTPAAGVVRHPLNSPAEFLKSPLKGTPITAVAVGPSTALRTCFSRLGSTEPGNSEVVSKLAAVLGIASPWNQIPRLSRRKPAKGAACSSLTCVWSPLGGLCRDSAGRFDRPDASRASYETASSFPGGRST